MKKEYEAPEVKRFRFELADTLMDQGAIPSFGGTGGGGLNPPYSLNSTNGYNGGNNPY